MKCEKTEVKEEKTQAIPGINCPRKMYKEDFDHVIERRETRRRCRQFQEKMLMDFMKEKSDIKL